MLVFRRSLRRFSVCRCYFYYICLLNTLMAHIHERLPVQRKNFNAYEPPAVFNGFLEGRALKVNKKQMAQMFPNMLFTNKNGQLRLGPPSDWVGHPPGQGTEVYVSNIPRTMRFEKIACHLLLRNTFQTYTMRLMMNLSGVSNRGYGYIRYCSVEDAIAAQIFLDGMEIVPGRRLHASISMDNNRLFLKNIPQYLSAKKIRSDLELFVNELTKVFVLYDYERLMMNRGSAFIEFECHRSADIARRKINSLCQIDHWLSKAYCVWAIPEEPFIPQAPKIFVRNLVIMPEQYLRNCLLAPVKEDITRFARVRDFAFVEFTNFHSAKWAMEKLNGLTFIDIPIYAEWAKPNNNNLKK